MDESTNNLILRATLDYFIYTKRIDSAVLCLSVYHDGAASHSLTFFNLTFVNLNLKTT